MRIEGARKWSLSKRGGQLPSRRYRSQVLFAASRKKNGTSAKKTHPHETMPVFNAEWATSRMSFSKDDCEVSHSTDLKTG